MLQHKLCMLIAKPENPFYDLPDIIPDIIPNIILFMDPL